MGIKPGGIEPGGLRNLTTSTELMETGEWGGPISDRYSGTDIGNSEISTGNSYAGSYSLKNNGGVIWSQSNSNFPYYPGIGDKVYGYLLRQASDSSPGFGIFNSSTSDSWPQNDGLGFKWNGRDGNFEVFVEGSSKSFTSITSLADKWYRFELDTAENGSGNTDWRVRIFDGDSPSDPTLKDISGTQSGTTMPQTDGIKMADKSNEKGFYLDNLVAVPGGGTP